MQQSDPAIGKVIDGYKILDVLGQGGMGIVYKAEDLALSRVVALKMIAPDLASKETFLRRFQSEARALARVDSPYIVGVHTLRKSGQHVFIVMEYVDGWTLSDEMNKGMLESRRSYSILRQLLQAFSHAHGVGVIHRDIKPSNIMLTRAGRVKVTDFGLAKLRREDGMSTVTQGIAGTARYMSPEQVQGKKIDPRSDIYSLGMTLYHMFAGKLPFEPDEGTYSILRRVVEEDFPAVSELNKNIPPALSELITKSLAKEPDERFQSAEEMLLAVESIIQQSEKDTAGTIPYQRGRQDKKSRRPLAFALVATAFLLLIPLYFLFLSGGDGGEKDPLVQQHAVPIDSDSTSVSGQDVASLLSITSDPGDAEVYANNEFLGVTPLIDFELSPGEHNLRVIKEGYQPRLETVTIESGKSTHDFKLEKIVPEITQVDPLPPVRIDPEPVVQTELMRLSADPEGVIFVNSDRFDSQSEQQWPEGEYTLRFVDPDDDSLSCEQTVTLRSGSPVDLTCYFEHKLTIITTSESSAVAPYANLFLNGEDLDATPLADQVVSSGTYTIELRRYGYVIDNPSRTLELRPTFDLEQTIHKETFSIRPE